MKRWLITSLAFLSVAVVASGQPAQKIPDIGEIMHRSKDKDYISDGCSLAFSFPGRHFICAAAKVSISRAPGEFSPASTAVLSCGAATCIMTFPLGADRVAYADWIMPPSRLKDSHLLISWRSAGPSGSVRWQVDSCHYGAGAPICTPTSTVVTTTPQGTVSTRMDTVLDLEGWDPTEHVILGLRRVGYNPALGDTLNADVALEGFRIDFDR